MGVIRPAFDISIVIWVPYSLLLASIESRNKLDCTSFRFLYISFRISYSYSIFYFYFLILIYIQGMLQGMLRIIKIEAIGCLTRAYII